MEKHNFYGFLKQYMKKYPDSRKGQAAYNLMYHYFPEKAQQYTGTDLDPFYHDERTDAFINACLNC